MRLRISTAVWLCSSIASGCAGDRDENASGGVSITSVTLTTTSPSGTDTGSDGATSSPEDDTADTGDKFDVMGGEATGADSGEACAAIDVMSDVGLQPADIIVVVDNSGSMEFEANSVQANLNAFSSQIFLANIDAHVVLLSSYPNVGHGICLDPPLGSGGCPDDDDNPPLYTHIPAEVDSTNGLSLLIQHSADFAGVMRQTASKHIIFVSDDNSDLSAADFTAMWTALDPSYTPFLYHAIASLQDPVTSCLDGNASHCCAISAAASIVHHQLVDQTGGVWGNLCEQMFQPVFDAVAEQVVQGSALACEYAIPEAPEGESFDPAKVNVEFHDDTGAVLQIGHVDTAADCAGVTDGWYYDDPADPMTIVLCPQTCDQVQGFTTASVSIGFGCATIPAG
jgi:hypothetical protein